MSQAVKRACDACHRRKVKCDGLNPCRNCGTAQLACTYNAVPQKKGPKGSRAKVISELRETQRQTSLSAKVHNHIMGGGNPEGPPSQTMSLRGTPGLLTMEQIKASIDFYFDHLYPMVPILNRQRLSQQTMYMDQNQSMDTYCLLSSLVAYTMIQPGAPLPAGDNGFNLANIPGAHIAATQILIDETVRVRKGLDYVTQPTFNSLCTNYFLFAASYCLEYHDKAWYYLREATTLISMSGMDQEETYLKFDGVEASRRRRLFWLFFVAERIFALQHGKPLSLQPTINLPAVTDDPSDEHCGRLAPFCRLINLFRPFDIVFTLQWTKLRNDFDPKALANLHGQLTQLLPTLANGSDPTQNLMANQQWLKCIDWRIRFQNGTLEPDNQEANTALQYGRDLSADIESMSSQFSSPRTGLVGRGMIGKILDVSFAMTEYLVSCTPTRLPFAKGPQDHLDEVLNILSALRSGNHVFLPSLMSKVHEALHKLPKPMLLEVPEALAQNLDSVDMFDGFGSLGMAQIPEFEEKKYVPDINTTASMGAAMTTMPDMTSPFSPAIMSPGGMEFPQTLQDFNTPLEMMSPVGQTSGGQNMQNLSPGSMMNSSPPNSQHHQVGMQHQTMNPQQMPGLNQQMGMAGMTTTMGGMAPGPMANVAMMNRPHQQRANSFAMGGIPRTVGDFQALQRVKTEPQQMPQVPQLTPAPQPGGMPGGTQMNMAAMGEMDFGNLRR